MGRSSNSNKLNGAYRPLLYVTSCQDFVAALASQLNSRLGPVLFLKCVLLVCVVTFTSCVLFNRPMLSLSSVSVYLKSVFLLFRCRFVCCCSLIPLFPVCSCSPSRAFPVCSWFGFSTYCFLFCYLPALVFLITFCILHFCIVLHYCLYELSLKHAFCLITSLVLVSRILGPPFRFNSDIVAESINRVSLWGCILGQGR